MAKVITGGLIQKRRSRLPDEWFDGQTREFTRGEDFHGKPSTFRTSLYQAASRRGLRASASIVNDDTLHFKAR